MVPCKPWDAIAPWSLTTSGRRQHFSLNKTDGQNGLKKNEMIYKLNASFLTDIFFKVLSQHNAEKVCLQCICDCQKNLAFIFLRKQALCIWFTSMQYQWKKKEKICFILIWILTQFSIILNDWLLNILSNCKESFCLP